MRRIAKLTTNPVMLALVCGLALAGCASKKSLNSPADIGLGGGGAGAATPGSAQDFTVNVGDRIFFDTDSSAIRADAQQTLTRQAQWLNQYRNYAIVIEGHADERGTREYNLALGARRAAATRDFLICAGRCGKSHQDDLLRQGTSGRGLRRHFLLVAEPPRRHHAERRRELIFRCDFRNSRRRSSGRRLHFARQTKFGRSLPA